MGLSPNIISFRIHFWAIFFHHDYGRKEESLGFIDSTETIEDEKVFNTIVALYSSI